MLLNPKQLVFLRSKPISELIDFLDRVGSQDVSKASELRHELGLATTNGHVHGNAKADGPTKQDLSRLLGVAVMTIDSWMRAGMPCNKTGKTKAVTFELDNCFAWYVNRQRKPDEDTEELERETKREALLSARLKREELEGKLCHVEVVRKEILGYAETLRTLGTDLEASYGKEALNMLNEAIESIRGQLSNE